MIQRELAAVLGIDPATASRDIRQGMPADDVEAARAWRRRHRRPYFSGRVGASSVASEALTMSDFVHRLQAGPLPDPADVVDMLFREHALVPRADALVIAHALGAAAQTCLRMGQPLGKLEPALRAALRALPDDMRDPMPYTLQVVVALVEDVATAGRAADAELIAAGELLPPEQRPAMSDEEARYMGAFWYRVAAGEVTFNAT